MVSSCSSINSLKKPESNAPFVCSSGAYLDMKKYGLPPIPSKSDPAFHKWTKDAIMKYVVLKDGYDSLAGCVQKYHPETKDRFK